MHHRILEVARLAPEEGIDQHKAGERIAVVQEHGIADASGNRGQVKLHRYQHNQHDAPPENRHGVASQGDADRGMVKDGAALHRRENADRDTHGDGEDHGADAQFQRGFKARYELIPHRDAALERNAQIAMQHAVNVVNVLFPQRLVEAKGRHQLSVALRGDPALARHDQHRIAGDHMHEREGQQGNADKCRDDKSQTSEYELQHKPDSQSFPAAVSCGIYCSQLAPEKNRGRDAKCVNRHLSLRRREGPGPTFTAANVGDWSARRFPAARRCWVLFEEVSRKCASTKRASARSGAEQVGPHHRSYS